MHFAFVTNIDAAEIGRNEAMILYFLTISWSSIAGSLFVAYHTRVDLSYFIDSSTAGPKRRRQNRRRLARHASRFLRARHMTVIENDKSTMRRLVLALMPRSRSSFRLLPGEPSAYFDDKPIASKGDGEHAMMSVDCGA